ncbi:DUF2442 domain-containing protein [Desulfococcaceae bacterium HSG8]|nr:DUF2442 domain-containing protein [Desulfococcaceae bacterium HSG8]
MYPSVINVVVGENYVLSVDFDNGECGTLDMKPFLDFGVFQRLKNPNVFKQVRVAFDTIEWNSGVDLDPEFVYSKCRGNKNAPDPNGFCGSI